MNAETDIAQAESVHVSPPRRLTRWPRLGLATLGALAYAASFAPLEWTWAAWLAPALWLIAIQGASARGRFEIMLAAGYVGTALVVHWLTALFSFGAIFLWVVPALYFALWGLLSGVFPKAPPLLRAAWIAVSWAGIEYLRAELMPLAFAFGGLGSSQANAIGFGMASVIGVYGVGGVVIFTSALLIELLQRENRTWPAITGGITLLVALGATAWFQSAEERESLGVVLLQQLDQQDEIAVWTSIPTREPEMAFPDLIVWPELVYANDPRLPECQWFVSLMEQDAARTQWGSIFGAVRLPEGSKNILDPFYNSVYLMKPEGEITDWAVKNQPVQLIADGMPADDVKVMTLGTGPDGRAVLAGVGICYDGSFQQYSRKMVQRGAQALIFPTMNIESWGPIQHVQHQRLFQMRAAENGRSVLVAAVSGPTFSANPWGFSGERAPFHETVTISAEMLRPHDTVFTKIGWLTSPISLGLTVLGLAYAFIIRRRRKSILP